jgi:hypothetical protein
MHSEVVKLFEQMLLSPAEPDGASYGHAISSATKRSVAFLLPMMLAFSLNGRLP